MRGVFTSFRDIRAKTHRLAGDTVCDGPVAWIRSETPAPDRILPGTDIGGGGLALFATQKRLCPSNLSV